MQLVKITKLGKCLVIQWNPSILDSRISRIFLYILWYQICLYINYSFKETSLHLTFFWSLGVLGKRGFTVLLKKDEKDVIERNQMLSVHFIVFPYYTGLMTTRHAPKLIQSLKWINLQSLLVNLNVQMMKKCEQSTMSCCPTISCLLVLDTYYFAMLLTVWCYQLLPLCRIKLLVFKY